MAKLQKCQWCKRNFETTDYHKRKFCSIGCYLLFKDSKRPIIKCPVCNKSFKPRMTRTGKIKQTFCCKKCMGKSKTLNAFIFTKKCEFCGKDFTRQTRTRFIQRFCSPRCAYDSRVKKKKVYHGYIRIRVPRDFPGATKNGWMYEHRYIVQQEVGRPLKDWEVVHHINGDKKDNRPENLELIPNRGEHNTKYQRLEQENIKLKKELERLRILISNYK